MGPDLLAKVLLLPCLQLTIVLVEYRLQPLRIKPCCLPQLSRGRLKKGMGIERVALYVLGRWNIETESRSDQRAAGFGVGIGRQHPAFMSAVSKGVHQGR